MVGLSAADVIPAALRTPPVIPPSSQLHKTMVGAVGSPFAPPDAGAPAAAQNRTIVGMTPPVVPGAAELQPGSAANRTLLGGVHPGPPVRAEASPRSLSATAVGPGSPSAGEGSSRTMIGVAMPGIAPLHPGEAPEPSFGEGLQPDPQNYRPAGELGATVGPEPAAWRPGPARAAPAVPLGVKRPRERDGAGQRLPPAAAAQPRAPTRVIAVVGAALGLALVAVLVAFFWKSTPPITARARVDAEGREVVEVRCPGCPDGTTISVAGGTARIEKEVAEVPVATPLSVGENLLKVAVDRPGGGRDETVSAQINIAYRIRPDLLTLQGERPAIQILMEAVTGTTIALDGKPIPLNSGRATETIDVTEACTGLSDEPGTLSRQIPYTVTLPGSPAPEQGVIQVSVGILPLRIDAPGPHAVIDGKNFVLAGSTSKGAEVLAAGRPIQVKADGSFAQVMNVSSVGATQIEVRAKMPGKAPRLTRISVKRVESLETAAAEFAAEKPVGYAAIAADVAASAGKPVVLAGEVIESRRQNHQTIMLLGVAKSSGCAQADGAKGGEACPVRLVLGADKPVKRGDLITAYGHVTRPFSVKGKPDIPEVEVDFTLKGVR